ncbi:hypothetical protein [Streptomyces sp. 6N223]|uniref:hypothetical protein n=1 Tax=Streptomyces sp. 6N223 TaxID=3457412 RepID=UPI003FCFCB84
MINPYTREDVVQAAPVDPWQRQEQFSNALDVEEMEQAAATYRQAAVEAANTGELAQKADEVSSRAAALGDKPLADPAPRIEHTDLGMQGNGKGMDETANVLIQAMTLAIDKDAAVKNEITGLHGALGRRHQEALTELYGWDRALQAEINARREGGVTRFPGLPTLKIHYGDLSWDVPPSPTGGYQLPQNLADDIRRRHLEDLVKDATATDGEIADEINQYRRTLGERGLELMREGYDLADGPLNDLWTGSEVAEIDARMLREELAKPEADRRADLLDLYTQGLQGIRVSVENPPGGALGQLDDDDITYLKTFYSGIDQNMALGFADQTGVSRTNIANGYNMLTNPAIGGIDPAAAPDPNVPDPLQGIRSLLYESPDTSAGLEADMGRFNAFGDLMGSATVMPGHELARDLTRAAISGQELSATQHQVSDPSVLVDPITNTGSSGLLHDVSLNGAASNGILNDLPLRDELLGTQWDNSAGVADVVRSGTTIPQDILDGPLGHNDPAARPFVEAGYNVLDYAAANPDNINATYGSGYAKHGDLEAAVGDTALRYMDMIAYESQHPGMIPGENPNIFGERYAHAFGLTDVQRQDVFTVMANADEPIQQEFFKRVHEWEAGVADSAFQRSGNVQQLGTEFESLGRVAGAVEYAQNQAGIRTDETAQASTLAGVNNGAAAIGAAVEGLGRQLPILGTAVTIAEAARYGFADQNALAETARLDGLYYGDWAVRTLVADAAANHGFGATPDNPQGAAITAPLRPTTLRPEDMAGWAGNTEGSYADYARKLQEGYAQGNTPR